jgi:hypothetical protein
VNAAPVEVICLFHHAPVIEAPNRHVMERTAPTPLSIFATTLST